MEMYAIPVLQGDKTVKWIHADDFDPEIHHCCCPECKSDRQSYRKILNQIEETRNENR